MRTGTLSFWKWKLGRETQAAARVEATRPRRIADRAPFIPIRVAAVQADHEGAAPPATDDSIDVELLIGAHRFGVRGRIDAAWLVQVLRGLAGPAC